MKKVSKARPGTATPDESTGDLDEVPDDFDFSRAVRLPRPKGFHEGARVYVNDAPFIVRGRSFVPDPSAAPAKNGKRPPKKK